MEEDYAALLREQAVRFLHAVDQFQLQGPTDEDIEAALEGEQLRSFFALLLSFCSAERELNVPPSPRRPQALVKRLDFNAGLYAEVALFHAKLSVLQR